MPWGGKALGRGGGVLSGLKASGEDQTQLVIRGIGDQTGALY